MTWDAPLPLEDTCKFQYCSWFVLPSRWHLHVQTYTEWTSSLQPFWLVSFRRALMRWRERPLLQSERGVCWFVDTIRSDHKTTMRWWLSRDSAQTNLWPAREVLKGIGGEARGTWNEDWNSKLRVVLHLHAASTLRYDTSSHYWKLSVSLHWRFPLQSWAHFCRLRFLLLRECSAFLSRASLAGYQSGHCSSWQIQSRQRSGPVRGWSGVPSCAGRWKRVVWSNEKTGKVDTQTRT